MKNLIITSELQRELAPNGWQWLVIGPYCWGRSPSLAIALTNAEAERADYYQGTFTARQVPDGAGALTIEFDGSWTVEGMTPEHQQKAKDSFKVVAVTKEAASLWKTHAAAMIKTHRKAIAAIKKGA